MALIVFEDEHLLVVNKPAGMNTHSPSPYAGEGIYEWLKNREPRWATLAIIHRLDKETSGILVFGKTPIANRSLTEQFTARKVRKKYHFLTDHAAQSQQWTAVSSLVRAGEKYVSRSVHAGADKAETRFRVLEQTAFVPDHGKKQKVTLIEAEPVTGRTHQIRVHAAEHGVPILGDTLYGGAEANRVCLHAAKISFGHPATNEDVQFSAEPEFQKDRRLVLRSAAIDATATNAMRLIHGAADGWPGLYVERFGELLLAQSEAPLDENQLLLLARLREACLAKGVYHKRLNRRIRGASTQQASPEHVSGEGAGDEIVIQENHLQFAIRFNEGYSVGIFLDQRENRRRLLANYISPDFFLSTAVEAGGHLRGMTVLNTFAYTCAFSICAAKAGATVTSLDLSRKYLEWGRRNFELNGIDPAQHDFIYGDTFDWLRRFSKKARLFDIVILDPPTFSQSKEHGMFRAEKDYGTLVTAALSVLKPGGTLLCSTNAADLPPEKFLEMIHAAVKSARRKIVREHYVPQPVDFPVSKDEPAYLKTVWLKIE